VRLYVGNLSFDAADEDLREVFAATGTVDEATVVTRGGSGRPRGFGFVTMGSNDDAAEAIRQLNGTRLDGRKLKVSVAKERKDA